MRPYLGDNERTKHIVRSLFETTIEPSSLNWMKIVKAGSLFRVLIAFNLWTYLILYGVNLRSSLISQDFEHEVNSWR